MNAHELRLVFQPYLSADPADTNTFCLRSPPVARASEISCRFPPTSAKRSDRHHASRICLARVALAPGGSSFTLAMRPVCPHA